MLIQKDISAMDMHELTSYRQELIEELVLVNEKIGSAPFHHNREDGSATDNQIEYVKKLLNGANLKLDKSYEDLSSWDCNCIISVINKGKGDVKEQVRDHFETLCWIDFESQGLDSIIELFEKMKVN